MLSKLRNKFENVLYGVDPPARLDGRAPSVATSNSLSSADEKHFQVAADEKNSETTSTRSNGVDNNGSPQRQSEPKYASIWRSPTMASITSRLQHPPANPDGKPGSWTPTLLQLRPLIGICSLMVTIACLFGSLIVLLVSDQQVAKNWPFEPTVCLALLTAIGNSALMLARSQAIPIAWWYNASRGASVRMLGRQWAVSNSIVRAILHCRHFSLMNAATIAATIAIMDGALLQRASTVHSTTTVSTVTLDLVLPPELPSGFSGVIWHDVVYLTETFGNVMDDWTDDQPIHMKVPQCTGSCYATIRAPGLKMRARTSYKKWDITPEILSSTAGEWGPWHGWAPEQVGEGGWVARNSIFFASILGSSKPYADDGVTIQTGLAQWTPDAEGKPYGQYVFEAHLYSPAIFEYDVLIEDDTISIVGPASEGRFVELANNTAFIKYNDYSNKQPTTLDAITASIWPFVASNASAILGKGGKGACYVADYATFNAETVKHTHGWGNLDVRFSDPKPSMLSKFNAVMFRGAVASAAWANVTDLIDEGVSIHQSVQATQKVKEAVFHTDLRWYAGAVILQLAAVILVLPMFWGFWTLGASTTMSPLAIALAFDSPLFRDVNSASGALGVIRERGDMRLKYGLVNEDGEPGMREEGAVATGRLGIGESGQVSRPRAGMHFQT